MASPSLRVMTLAMAIIIAGSSRSCFGIKERHWNAAAMSSAEMGAALTGVPADDVCSIIKAPVGWRREAVWFYCLMLESDQGDSAFFG
jgi:hypothetical protein